MQQNAGELQPVAGKANRVDCQLPAVQPWHSAPFAELGALKHHSHHIWLLKDFCELSL